jgi:hypothetical protein
MKSSWLLVCLFLGACSPESAPQSGTDTATTKFISTDETRQVAMHVLLNRYPQAQIVSELAAGQTWSYRFATNGTTLPVTVVVDRKTARATFKNLNP